MELIGYKTFNNNDEFSMWQKASASRKIINVVPLPIEINGDQTKTEFSVDFEIGVFVTFFYED